MIGDAPIRPSLSRLVPAFFALAPPRNLTRPTKRGPPAYSPLASIADPATIETPMTEGFLADDAMRADRMNRTPLGRLGQPEDVAYGALYLASDEASFVTGSELVIDGGRTAE